MKQLEAMRNEVIDRLVTYILERLPPNEVPLIKNFIRQYYLSVSPEDLSARSILDLYGAVMSHWNFIFERDPHQAKVRVYNPNLELNGWQSPHTVIEIGFDDMPFLVDSILIALNRLGINTHLIIHIGNIRIKRDKQGRIIEVADRKQVIMNEENWTTEATIFIEIDRQSDQALLDLISNKIHDVLNEVQLVVHDWPKMREKLLEIFKKLKESPPALEEDEISETLTFLNWIMDDHFTLMGYCCNEIMTEGNDWAFNCLAESCLGVFKRRKERPTARKFSTFSPAAQKYILSKNIIMLGKSDQLSSVHRPVYNDFFAVKEFDEQGNLSCEHKFIGLYTSMAYNSSPQEIPYLRRKVIWVLNNAGFAPKSHDDRALLNILETLPRDDLFQAPVEELLNLSLNVLHLQERQRIRLFIWKDVFDNFFSCLVYVPRDNYNTTLREKMQVILMKGLQGQSIEFTSRFSESSLAMIHFVIHVDPLAKIEYDQKLLEQQLIEVGRTWQEDLMEVLIEHCGEERAIELFRHYGHAFPAGYMEAFPARVAVVDIDYFDQLSDKKPLLTSLYRPLEDPEDTIRFKLFRRKATIPLSDVVPILEHMGLRIISERPYEIISKLGEKIWINDYRMVYGKGDIFDTEGVRDIFQEAFDHIWRQEAESDGFNYLILSAKLSWREISLLRAYAKYLWQAEFTVSQGSVEEVLCEYPSLTAELINLFKLRFNPDYRASDYEMSAQILKFEEGLNQVESLMEDRVLRYYMQVILATLRTNYFQTEEDGKFKSTISFKIQSNRVPELPLPHPLYEIFVYSPRVEAIHLRAAKVARGGIRWSDRRDDFRTETLGLMKAQQVKNAVIVPMGAKGGFFVKNPPESGSREQLMEEVVYCYTAFMQGLLDITDNIKGETVTHPLNVVIYDEEDPYLVVAADKGTATFSDIANAISHDYQFWLSDAFASGGKTGYDHKKMGITSRGAWESAKRHFQELGIDPHTQDFTTIGIGDMSGDVFGNGMLRSRHIKLVAAFNHQHIFLDPNPNAELSFIERERLFKLPSSGWGDYNKNLLSEGGGIFSRSLKSIPLSKEIQECLDFYQEKALPNEVIRAILKAPVVLFWNGGIGTYVKAMAENNIAVGDRANDALRINGNELRCLAVVEGGNLGLTQLGRIEYAKLGGKINTDAIDNSGGVNCSDYEVNIKILLNDVVQNGDLTEKQRNELLAEMEPEVAEFVLYNNRRQTEAISVAAAEGSESLEMYGRVIQELERVGGLDRALEFLPDKEEIALRKNLNQGLTRPEIAVLMAYSKIYLKKSLLTSNITEDPYIQKELILTFPKLLHARFEPYMYRHRLKRELIATRVSNTVVNEMGISFISRLQDETGAEAADVVRAYNASRAIFKAGDYRTAISLLGASVESMVLLKMLHELNRLVRRGARWFLRNRREGYDIEEVIKQFSPLVEEARQVMTQFLKESSYGVEALANELIEAKVPKPLAYQIGSMTAMYSILDIVEAALIHHFSIKDVTDVYFTVGIKLHLDWFRSLIKEQSVKSQWEALARAAFRDDIDRLQRKITISIMIMNNIPNKSCEARIEVWQQQYQKIVDNWLALITEVKNTSEVNFTVFSVALRELLDLSFTTAP